MNIIAQVDHWETIVYEDDTWKYLVPSSSVSNSWVTNGFNDVSWNSGSGGFGMADGDDNTVLAGGTISVFQRIQFTVTDVAAIEKLVFNIDYDDGFVAFINGVEIARSEMSANPFPAFDETAAGLHEAAMYQGQYPYQITLDQTFVNAVITNGTNVLCVQTHNQSAGSSDLSSRVFLHAGINNSSAYFGAAPGWFIPPVVLTTSNLPIVIVNTNGVNIPDEPKIDGTMGIIYNGPGQINSVSDAYNEFYGEIAIEVRGSSSGGFPMKSYGLETRGPSPEINYNASIFNWPADNDWILYAPYNDKALIRNVLTYKLGNEMGHYAPRTQMCELILNGEYQGVYVFMERIKQNPGRVNIDKLNYDDTTGNELTGGYIVKVDKTTGGGVIAWTSPYTCAAPGWGPIEFQLHDPDLDTLHPLQLQYIEDEITDWETALAGPDFSDPVLGYAPYIDEMSFIDFMLINEISKNVDGYRISTFLYKERESEGGEIVAGPLWDFNLAWGNADYCEGGLTSGWEIYFNSVCGGGGGLQNPFWWDRLLQDPDYAHMTNCRWQELRQDILHTDSLMNYIDEMALYLDEAQVRNYIKWPVLGIYLWPNNFIGATYDEEIQYLKDWTTNRVNWMDLNMFGACPDLNFDETQNQNLRVFPNPATDQIKVVLPAAGENSKLLLYSQDGKLVKEIAVQNQSEITLTISDLQGGIYLLQLSDEKNSHEPIRFIKF
ncbi:MAG: CotH kinase family protein [Crocinitomicaceae bacterium]|nr:CotH kinase family protein [Crocinitomicaceae bacterium]